MPADSGPGGVVELAVKPLTDRYDADDDRWLDQVTALLTTLRGEVGGVRTRTSVAEGQKGGIETIVLALGSSGAFIAAVEAFRAWLSRDRSRGLEITLTRGGEPVSLVFKGESIDLSTLKSAVEQVAGRLGEASWETPSTERS